MRRLDTKEWAVLALVVIFIGLQAWATYRYLTEPFTGGNDFYSRWAGARALLVDGRDPYSLEVTAEIQAVKGIDPALEGKGSFAYPLHVIFLFLPLAYLNYPLALAIWMTVLIWLVVALVVVLTRLYEWQPRPLPLAGLLLAVLAFYPVTRSILLGQFTIHVALFLALSLLLLRRGNDGWAGAALAAASVKSQMLVITAPWLLIWAVAQRRWRYVGGLFLAGSLMFLAALALFPGWPAAFLADLGRYAGVAGGKNPLEVLSEQVIPGGSQFLRYALTALLLALTVRFCWLGRSDTGRAFYRATYWTIVSGLLVIFQTGTTNQVLLLLPLIDWLSQLVQQRRGPALAIAALLALVILPWYLFINTVHGNAEAPVMFWPLPALALVVLLGLSRAQLVPRARPVARSR